MTALPELLEATMHRYDDAVPDGEALIRRVLDRLDETSPRRWPGAALAAGLAASAVVAVALVSSLTPGPGGDVRGLDDPAAPTSSGHLAPAPPSPGIPTAPPSAEPAAILDPLTYSLDLDPRRSDGTRASRLRVENRSGTIVVDPGCLAVANYSYGVVPVDRPGAPLRGRVITKCGGSQRLPNGYGTSFIGPDFDVRGLPPGRYLATIDFGESRSSRLSVPVTVR